MAFYDKPSKGKSLGDAVSIAPKTNIYGEQASLYEKAPESPISTPVVPCVQSSASFGAGPARPLQKEEYVRMFSDEKESSGVHPLSGLSGDDERKFKDWLESKLKLHELAEKEKAELREHLTQKLNELKSRFLHRVDSFRRQKNLSKLEEVGVGVAG